MALTAPHHLPLPEDDGPLPLESGDHLDRETFHARYEAMPEDFRAELIGGIVYVASPVQRQHGRHQQKLATWLGTFEANTPGVESYVDPTVILGDDEVQPDVCLLVSPHLGGQSRFTNEYITGAPELVVEIALSSASKDLHSKKHVYERAGVQEYVVVLVRQPFVFWYRRAGESFEQVGPGEDGVFRSEVFPGLWLDPAALLRLDSAGVLRTLQQGLASPEHAALVSRLTAAASGDVDQ